MQDYQSYDATDFALDDSFRRWVLLNTPNEAAFWDAWVATNVHRVNTVLQARQLVQELHQAQESLSDDELAQELNRLSIARQQLQQPVPRIGQRQFTTWMRIAASLMLVSIGAYLVYQIRQQQQPKTAYQLRTESVQQTLTEVRNDEQRNKSVPLSDGSVVELKPGSRVSFPKTFDARQREVYLTGEAFFQVAKNPNQPFYVYANELVVRVLGTSFTVSAFDLDKQVKVMVKTGKVSVFANQAVQKTKPQTANLILTPNQQAVFDRVNLGLKKSVVSTPEPLVAATEMGSLFHFNRTPITTVYKRLEQVYGVPIVYDAEVQKGCELSAELGDESLYDKISLICKATGSQYEIIDGQIIIYSKGCLQ